MIPRQNKVLIMELLESKELDWQRLAQALKLTLSKELCCLVAFKTCEGVIQSTDTPETKEAFEFLRAFNFDDKAALKEKMEINRLIRALAKDVNTCETAHAVAHTLEAFMCNDAANAAGAASRAMFAAKKVSREHFDNILGFIKSEIDKASEVA